MTLERTFRQAFRDLALDTSIQAGPVSLERDCITGRQQSLGGLREPDCARYAPPVKSYTFKCIRAGGPGPAVHMDICVDDQAARARALALFDLWPLAVKVDVLRGDEHFEVERSSAT